MPSRAAVAGLILIAVIAAILTYPSQPTLKLAFATEPIATLLPHAHGPEDKISDAKHGIQAFSVPVEVPETMWVTEMTFKTVNAPQGIIHHLNVVRITAEDTEDHPRRGVIATTGQDSIQTVRFPAPAGILLSKGDRLYIDAVLHNPVPPLGEGGIYKDVAVEVTLSGFRSNEGRFLPVYTNYALVSDSTGSEGDVLTFEVPAKSGSYTRSSTENATGIRGAGHRFPKDGWIIFMEAHLHAWEGGERVDAYLNSTLYRTFSSRLLDANIPWSFRTDAPAIMQRVKEGDLLTASATYVNENDEPVEGAMGMIGVYYVLDEFSLGSPLYTMWWTIRGLAYNAKDAILAPFR